MFFSDKLRLLRTQANLSQEDLADELHVSRQSVSKWESGISFPEIEKLISISDYFHVSLDALLKAPLHDTPITETHGSAGIAILRFFAVHARHLSAIGHHYAGWKN